MYDSDELESEYDEKYLIGKYVRIEVGQGQFATGKIENITQSYIVLKEVNRWKDPDSPGMEERDGYDPMMFWYIPGRPMIMVRQHD